LGIIGLQEGCDQCQGSNGKNAVIAKRYSLLMPVIGIGNGIVNYLRAERPARPPVRGNGAQNRKIGITSKDRKM
jgi:hypothetical protein